jgi:hypothetical protein
MRINHYVMAGTWLPDGNQSGAGAGLAERDQFGQPALRP